MRTDQLWCPACGAVWPPPETGELPACDECAACVQDVRQGIIPLDPGSVAVLLRLRGKGGFAPADGLSLV